MYEETTQYLRQIHGSLCCPKCEGNLEVSEDSVACLDCLQCYPIVDNIPLLFWANEWENSKKDVTDIVRQFYEQTPFPNYDAFDNVGILIDRAREGIFARLLDEQIPFGASVLECGCGTGQLSNFLSIANRTVIGTDICLNSLRLGQEFKKKNELKRIHFFQMNLFRPIFKPETFDFVVCNGVLHHTSDPFLGYKSIATLVKPNGYILIGLYHKYGRIATDIRRFLFKITKNRLKFLDSRIVDKYLGETKRDTWFADQYKHPHESKHTVKEVKVWLDQTGFKFVKSIPQLKIHQKFDENEELLKPQQFESGFKFVIVELSMAVTGLSEGGFFIVIAQKQS